MTMNEKPKRQRGAVRLSADKKREHCVSVRMNREELAWLDETRESTDMQRGEYLRAAAMGVLPPTIPAINQEAWLSLSRLAGNLNQFQQAINEGRAHGYPPRFIESIRKEVGELRRSLIGASPETELEEEIEVK